jgi:hypothetical protein
VEDEKEEDLESGCTTDLATASSTPPEPHQDHQNEDYPVVHDDHDELLIHTTKLIEYSLKIIVPSPPRLPSLPTSLDSLFLLGVVG